MDPEKLYYTKEHEWLRVEEGGKAVVGITDHAQKALGDITFIELPKTGKRIKAGDAMAMVESVKAASDIFAPVTGTVAEVNPTLAATPETVNRDPYGTGWLCRLSECELSRVQDLMSAEQYRQYVAGQ
jgi:glycine cleavage system H protein